MNPARRLVFLVWLWSMDAVLSVLELIQRLRTNATPR